MDMIVTVAIMAGFGVGGYKIAQDKNRDPVLWCVLCVLFTGVAMLILATRPRVDIDATLQKALEDSLRG